jgi:hypothetical protein
LEKVLTKEKFVDNIKEVWRLKPMKKYLVFFLCIFISNVCFAQTLSYRELTFEKAKNNHFLYSNLMGHCGFIKHRTKNEILYEKFLDTEEFSYYLALMLNAKPEKRIFLFTWPYETGYFGYLYVKINDDEYVEFYTGK